MFRTEKKRYPVVFVDDSYIYVDDLVEKINWRKVRHFSIHGFLPKKDEPYLIVTYAIFGKLRWIKSMSLYLKRRVH